LPPSVTPADIAALKAFCDAVHPLPLQVWDEFAAIWHPFSAKRKELLTAAGDVEKYLYFVLEGIQRSWYVKDEGREATVVFTYPYSFSGVADSVLTQKPSRFYFETLTQSRFLRTSWHQVHELALKHHPLETFIRTLTGFTLSGLLERQVELLCFSAEEKFRTLLKRSPHVLQMIPHKYLASYLGIDPTTFSKLLGTVRI
jgi:CRP-like cAMP-binding protein